jgi:hypothetical protein
MGSFMNWSTGLYRLWVVAAVIWTGGILIFTVPDVLSAFKQASTFDPGALNIPIECTRAKGVEGTDYKLEEQGPWTMYRLDRTKKFCMVTETNARAWISELRDYSRADLVETLTSAQGNYTLYPRPWQIAGYTLMLIMLPPLLVFSLGVALFWISRGFRAR